MLVVVVDHYMMNFMKIQANMYDQKLFNYLQGFEPLHSEIGNNIDLTPHDGVFDEVLQLPKHLDQSFKDWSTKNVCVDGKCDICKHVYKRDKAIKSDKYVHCCNKHEIITLPPIEESPTVSYENIKDVRNYIKMLRYMQIYLNKKIKY